MFELQWTPEAAETYQTLRGAAIKARETRQKNPKRRKSSQTEGLFGQVHKTLTLLADNPKHPGLQTHAYSSLAHPFEARGKVFEAYAQNRTPGAYRVFWCYGPAKKQITIIAITPHP